MLQLLIKLFGKGYINKIIGTRANVTKPIKFDANSPYKLYSDEAFENPKSRALIESKLEEYGPLVLSNKNASEISNFEMNARRLIEAKNKEFGVTDRLKETRTQKPEADVIDIKTGKKAEGIESLKEDLGLPPEVSPKSRMGGNLQELKRLTKEADLARKDIDETMDKGLEDIFNRLTKKPAKDVMREGQRRAVIRQIMLKDKNIKLPENEFDNLLFSRDLESGTGAKDPLELLDKYYERDINKLEALDEIIDSTGSAEEAADTFIRRGGFRKKGKPKTAEEMMEEGDMDPSGMAKGGLANILRV